MYRVIDDTNCSRRIEHYPGRIKTGLRRSRETYLDLYSDLVEGTGYLCTQDRNDMDTELKTCRIHYENIRAVKAVQIRRQKGVLVEFWEPHYRHFCGLFVPGILDAGTAAWSAMVYLASFDHPR